MSSVRLESPRGLTLAGTLHRPRGGAPAGAAVVCHGMLSSRASAKHIALCEALARRGVAALRFDFAGRGDSEGRLEDLSYHDQVEDLGAAVQWLRGELGLPVVLSGSSMGGAVVILYAATDPDVVAVAGAAAVGRPGSVSGRIGADLERWERQGYVDLEGGLRLGRPLLDSAREVDVVSAAGALTCPLLLVHGAEDDVVPVAQAHELNRVAADGCLVVLDECDHVFSEPAHRGRLIELVSDFFVERFSRD